MRIVIWGFLMLAATVNSFLQAMAWGGVIMLIAQAREIEFDFNTEEDYAEWDQQRLDSLQYSIELYREYSDADHWRARVPIDRQVSRDAGGLSIERLASVLHENPQDIAVGTAVAVCIGDCYVSEEQANSRRDFCALFAELLASPHDRIRYRASESIIQRMFDDSLPNDCCADLLASVNLALHAEKGALNLPSLDYAQQLLETEMGLPD